MNNINIFFKSFKFFSKTLSSSLKILIFFLIFIPLIVFNFSGCSQMVDTKIYFAKYEDNTTYLAPEIRPVLKDENFYKNIIDELIKGPKSEQLLPTIPSTVAVNSVIIEDGLAIIDFSKEIITDTSTIPHSSTTENLAIFSIVDTLTEFTDIKKVRITVEGKQKGTIDGFYIEDFWGHVSISEDFVRNEEILMKN